MVRFCETENMQAAIEIAQRDASNLAVIVPIVRAERRDIEMAVEFHGCLVLEGYEIMTPGATVLWDEPE